jgi:hypothetical protein
MNWPPVTTCVSSQLVVCKGVLEPGTRQGSHPQRSVASAQRTRPIRSAQDGPKRKARQQTPPAGLCPERAGWVQHDGRAGLASPGGSLSLSNAWQCTPAVHSTRLFPDWTGTYRPGCPCSSSAPQRCSLLLSFPISSPITPFSSFRDDKLSARQPNSPHSPFSGV